MFQLHFITYDIILRCFVRIIFMTLLDASIFITIHFWKKSYLPFQRLSRIITSQGACVVMLLFFWASLFSLQLSAVEYPYQATGTGLDFMSGCKQTAYIINIFAWLASTS